MCDTIMIPLRAAIPKTLINPMSEATERIPPDRYTPTTPPIMASGRLIMIKSVSRTDRKTMWRRKPIPIAFSLKEQGIQINVVGVGGSPDAEAFDEEELKQIASQSPDGTPMYVFIRDTSSLIKEFQRQALLRPMKD